MYFKKLTCHLLIISHSKNIFLKCFVIGPFLYIPIGRRKYNSLIYFVLVVTFFGRNKQIRETYIKFLNTQSKKIIPESMFEY